MSNETWIKTTCLTISLATAWMPSNAGAVDNSVVNVNLNFNASSLNNTYLAFTVNGSGYSRFGPFNFNGSENFDFPTPFMPDDFNTYILVGTYAQGAVAMSFSDSLAAEGLAFETVFPGFNEPAVAGWLETNDTANLDVFFQSGLGRPEIHQFIDTQASMIQFSDGVLAGDVTVSVRAVPEPASMVVLGGVLVLLARRR